MKIAIVGTGIAGLSAAYVLARVHDVALFEANDYPGGHVHTVAVGDSLAIDTGFIVHNRESYPLLTRLFEELGVRTQPTVMSFSMTCSCGVAWSSRRPWRAGRLLVEITRFLRSARHADLEGKTLDDFLRDERYSGDFRWHYLVPMTSALWSAAPGRSLDLPASFAIGFLGNHGMLGLRRRRWRTVVGGSRRYVDALLERIGPARVALGRPVRAVERRAEGITLRLADATAHDFDAAVVATHAPTALSLLAHPTAAEQRLLPRFEVTENEIALHTDARFLPRHRADRAGWNYQSPGCGVDPGLPTVTYSMNRLQSLASADEWCVTLNRTDEIDPALISGVYRFAHPRLSLEAYAAQRELASLNDGRLAFAGAWQGNGFHEDGIRSGIAAAGSLGVEW